MVMPDELQENINKLPKRIRCWLAYDRYGYIVMMTLSSNVIQYWRDSPGYTVTPGFFIPEKPKRKARRKP